VIEDPIYTRSHVFINAAGHDIYKVEHMRDYLLDNSIVSMSYTEGDTEGCIEICVDSMIVLTIMNSAVFPVTPMLDSISLSKKGQLNLALDIRPFMFSGPCPTSMVWTGTDDTLDELGYHSLTSGDVVNAFVYWLSYVFGVNPEIEIDLE